MNFIKSHKKIIYPLALLTFVYFMSSFYFTFGMDEEFTMGLIRYSYRNLIRIDSLDVHPPLYYLCLKFFLSVTTFWTHSIFIKVLFARFFSVIISLLDFYTIIKIFKKLNIKTNSKLLLLFYSFVPSIILYATTIRMYSLSSLFLSLELYFIIMFNNNDKIINLILLTVFASLAAYTHYYVAVSAGLFIFILFVINLLKHYWYKSWKYVLAGICFILSYLPIITFASKQYSYESHIEMNKADWNAFLHEIYASLIGVGSSSGIFKFMYVTLSVILLFILIIWSHYYINNKKFHYYFIIVLVNYLLTLLVAIISGIINGTPFMSRYVYADFYIYMSFIVVIFIFYLYKYRNKMLYYLVLILSLLFVFNSCGSLIKNIKDYDIPSIVLIKYFNSWKNNKSDLINIDKNSVTKPLGKPLYIFSSAIYLKSIHKKALVHYSNNTSKKSIEFSLFGGHENGKLYKYISGNNISIKK